MWCNEERTCFSWQRGVNVRWRSLSSQMALIFYRSSGTNFTTQSNNTLFVSFQIYFFICFCCFFCTEWNGIKVNVRLVTKTDTFLRRRCSLYYLLHAFGIENTTRGFILLLQGKERVGYLQTDNLPIRIMPRANNLQKLRIIPLLEIISDESNNRTSYSVVVVGRPCVHFVVDHRSQ